MGTRISLLRRLVRDAVVRWRRSSRQRGPVDPGSVRTGAAAAAQRVHPATTGSANPDDDGYRSFKLRQRGFASNLDIDSPPIIICGFPRTGTTFLRELLEAHPEISISREFRMTPTCAQLVNGLSAELEIVHARPQERWRGLTPPYASSAILRSLWYYLEPEKLVRRRWGNKTPHNEKHLELYEHVFRATPPRYVYTLREPLATIASHGKQSWGKADPVDVLLDLQRSIAMVDAFQAMHPERVHWFQVDSYTDRESQCAAVERLFAFLGEKPTAEVWAFVERWPKVNPAPSGAREKREFDLDEIRARPEFAAVARRLGYA